MPKLEQVSLRGVPDLSAYSRLAPEAMRKVRTAARGLRGFRVIHVNATENGGGVAELLKSQVRFERALGMRSQWHVLRAPAEFFGVTKKMHNLLQGKPGSFSREERMIYLETGHRLGDELHGLASRADLVVLHDPQTLPLVDSVPAGVPAVSRLHIDLLTPNPAAVEFIRPFLERSSRTVLSSREYAGSLAWLPARRLAFIPPAIDPLSAKNRHLSEAGARRILQGFGINCTKPVVSQVSRFDPWKDPMGVIRAYYLAKNKIPDLQLVLSGVIQAQDDPEAIRIFAQIKKHAEGDPDIYLFADPAKLNGVAIDLLVNAVYTESTVVVQKSIREGFGLTMTEAMWKGKPLVAGRTTGAELQIRSGRNGFLVSSPEEAAREIVRLLRDPALRERLGRAARESVRKRFLMPRFVADNLRLYRLLGTAPAARSETKRTHKTH